MSIIDFTFPSSYQLGADIQLALTPVIPAGKTVTWADGTTETLNVDKYGKVSLNGLEKIAIGFHVKHGSYNPSVALAESMLQRLSSDGIRFMTFNFAHWETDAQVLYDIDFWMPLLYKYKIWTFLQVQHIDPEPPILTVAYQLPRHQVVIDKISQNQTWANMVYAYTVGWELDNWYNDAQVTAYLQAMVPSVKNLLQNSKIGNVPTLNKPTGVWGWNQNYGQVPLGVYADLVGLDGYANVTAAGSGIFTADWQNTMNTLYNTYLQIVGKVGHRVWHTEFGVFNNGLNNELTPNLFSQALAGMGHGNCGSMMLWLMWTNVLDNHAAFNPDGTPKQWYLNLRSLFA